MKHPDPVPPSDELLFKDNQENIHHVRYEEITHETIKRASVNTKSGSGPSEIDGEGWCRILTSKNFGSSSTDLCKTIVEIAKKMCAEEGPLYS